MLHVHKKLREARFFLEKMVEREQKAFGDHEEFDFYLSAFLSAGRSVRYRLHYEQVDVYLTFYDAWEKVLPSNEQRLIKFMADDRSFEVHESGSRRAEHEVHIPVQGTYQDKSGTLFAYSPVGTPPAEIIKPTYSFVIDGAQMSVLVCCHKYIDLLERLVRDFQQSQGIQ
jgi:hypothetical protein